MPMIIMNVKTLLTRNLTSPHMVPFLPAGFSRRIEPKRHSLLHYGQSKTDLVTFSKLMLTIPVGSARAESSFSAMKRVKTPQGHLTNLCLISIERSLSGDPLPIVDEFSSLANELAE